MSAVGFRPAQRVRFSSLALPTSRWQGVVVAAASGGPSLRTDQRVLVLWDDGTQPQWSAQDALVDEELYQAFQGRRLAELPWLGYAGPVQRWRLTQDLQRRSRR